MPTPQTDANQFLGGVIMPVLAGLGMDSPSAEKLLMMTACHESMGFCYRVQLSGPALSYFQIEPNTLDDLYRNYLSYRPGRLAQLDAYLPSGMPRLEALEANDAYACAAARMIYARVAEALPDVHDDMALADYAKRYWNTALGKATAEKYLADFHTYGPNPAPSNWA